MAGQLTTSPYNPGYVPTPALPGFGTQTQTDWFTQNAPPGTAGPAPTAPGTYPTYYQGGNANTVNQTPPGTFPAGWVNDPPGYINYGPMTPGPDGTVTGNITFNNQVTAPGSNWGAAQTPEHTLQVAMEHGLTGQAAADYVNKIFPNSVNWRADRNFFDFPGSNSYVHQPDAGGYSGKWDLVQRGADGGGSTGNADALASMAGLGPFNYSGPGQQQFTPKTGDFTPETMVNPDPFVAPTLSDTNDPGYAFRLAQAKDSVESAAAARGTLLTTGTLADVSQRVGDQASAEYANVYSRAFDTYKNAFSQSLQTNQENNQCGLAANMNSFNHEYSTTQLNNAAQATDFSQQLQKSQTNFDYYYKLAGLGLDSTKASFAP